MLTPMPAYSSCGGGPACSSGADRATSSPNSPTETVALTDNSAAVVQIRDQHSQVITPPPSALAGLASVTRPARFFWTCDAGTRSVASGQLAPCCGCGE